MWRIGEVSVASTALARSLLGRGSSVAPRAVVTDSVVGRGVVVEEDASIADSVLLPGARVAASASVEGSIIGPDAIIGQRCVIRGLSVIGAGAVTASGTVVDAERVPAGV
jgi:ADP-glucose pyrophosphorylase